MKRFWLQLLALLPLPLIVGLIVLDVRHHQQPPLILPGAGSAPSRPGLTLVVPTAPAAGWKLEGAPVSYDEKSLFERIDGAAPAFIGAGYLASWGGEFRKQGAGEPVSFDIYDMGSECQGLGMYAAERDPSYQFVSVGDEGYLASGSLNFWRGRYYVKLAGQGQGEAMDKELLELARGLASALPASVESGKRAELLKLLPPGRLPNSVGYARPALADVTGLEEVYFAEYPADGQGRYRLFVVKDSSRRIAERIAKARAYFETQKAKVQERQAGEGRVLVAKGEATVTLLVQRGEFLAGGVDLPKPELEAKLGPALLRSLGSGASEATEEKR